MTLRQNKLPDSVAFELWSVLLFYHASKIVWFVLEPSNLLMMATLVGAALCWTRFAAAGRRLALAAGAGLLVLGLSPAANWLILPLETRFPKPSLEGRPVDGIIMLGGAVLERHSAAHDEIALNDAGERILALVELARRHPQAKLVVTGGSGFYSGATTTEAEVLRTKIGRLGLPAERIIFEDRSVNTHENAIFSKALTGPRPGETWLLVTSAWHMPRSVGIFRAAGWPVVAYPVDFRTAGWRDAWRGFVSVSDGLRRADVATREWVGLVAYRLTGRSDALLPSP
jgi:uncharacterized SAM-binding protein YcdF (DUF218 family)